VLPFITWWAAIQIFGLAALPLTQRVFAWLPDRGYAFAKAMGLLLVAYMLWFGASAGILTNTSGGIFLALLLVAGISVWVGVWRGRFLADLRWLWRENKAQVLAVELLFLLAFAGWALIRAYTPEKILPAGGEKFMEIAFLNGVLNSPHFPPLDPWMAGYGISYYYFGYVMMAVMTRFSGVAATISFDLYDALTFALTAVTAYGVVYNLVATAGTGGRENTAGGRTNTAGGRTNIPAVAAGLLASLMVTILGNLEGLLEGLYSTGLLPAAFWEWINIPDLLGVPQNGSFYPDEGWWWWRASRVLHDLDLSSQPVLFQPIDEFPFFSFLLGDNHPHKMALPFVLLVVGLAFNLLMRQISPPRQEEDAPTLDGSSQTWAKWVKAQRGAFGLYLFYALALGSLLFLNTWDFPICLGLVLFAYTGGRVLTGERLDWRMLGQAAALGAGLASGAALLYIFFFLSFSSQAGGVLPYVFLPTRLAQYLVMFGPFIFILGFFTIGAAWRINHGRFLLSVVRAWGWICGLCFGLWLALLLAATLVISGGGMESSSYIQTFLQGMNLQEGMARALMARITDPWLFLVLSGLLAVMAASILPRRERRTLEDQPTRSGDNVNMPGPAPQPDAPATLFAMLAAFAGLALTLVVEFVYLRDNFGMRMNTIFKFYYQGWVMMAVASAYGAWWVMRYSGRLARIIFSAGAALLIGAGMVYPIMGIYRRVEEFSRPPNLDAAATFSGFYNHPWAEHPDDWAAIQWLLQNGRLPDGGVPRILEAGSGGYENAGRISAFTGYPTILGWTNHEGQWRGDYEEITRRTPVIRTIFTTADANTALDLLQEWQVRYVIIGDTERAYISKLCQEPANACRTDRAIGKFDAILTKVFSGSSTLIYQVPGPGEP